MTVAWLKKQIANLPDDTLVIVQTLGETNEAQALELDSHDQFGVAPGKDAIIISARAI